MAQLYSSGPALFYVGIPVQWSAVIAFIQQVQQIGLSGGGSAPQPGLVPFQPPPNAGRIVHTQPPTTLPSITIFIETLSTYYLPFFLGTTDEPPTIEIVPSWDEVETDAGGTEQASERLSEGEEGIIAARFTRFNEAVYLALAGRSQPNSFLGGFPGWGQVGKAMALEQLTLPLWIVFPYAGKDVFGLAGQPPGYRFYNTLVEGPDNLRQLGTPNRVTALQFRAQRLLQLVESLASLQQPYANYADIPINNPILPTGEPLTTDLDSSIGGLYDFDLTGLPNPD